MPKTKVHSHSGSPPARHHAAHHNNNHVDMDGVKIKRVKRNKKEITTKEKIVAGIGVGSSLMGGMAGIKPQAPTTQFVRTNTQSGNSAGSKVKSALNKIFGSTFGARQAKADDTYTDPGGITYTVNSDGTVTDPNTGFTGYIDASGYISQTPPAATSQPAATDTSGQDQQGSGGDGGQTTGYVPGSQNYYVQASGITYIDNGDGTYTNPNTGQTGILDAGGYLTNTTTTYSGTTIVTPKIPVVTPVTTDVNSGPQAGDSGYINGDSTRPGTYEMVGGVLTLVDNAGNQVKNPNGFMYTADGNGGWTVNDGQTAQGSQIGMPTGTYISSGGAWVLQQGQSNTPQEGATQTVNGLTQTYYQGNWVWQNGQTADGSNPSVNGTPGVSYGSQGNQWIILNGQTVDGSRIGGVAGVSYGSQGGTWIILDGQTVDGSQIGQSAGVSYISSGGQWTPQSATSSGGSSQNITTKNPGASGKTSYTDGQTMSGDQLGAGYVSGVTYVYSLATNSWNIQPGSLADGSTLNAAFGGLNYQNGTAYTYTGGTWTAQTRQVDQNGGVSSTGAYTQTFYGGQWVYNNGQTKVQNGYNWTTIGGVWVQGAAVSSNAGGIQTGTNFTITPQSGGTFLIQYTDANGNVTGTQTVANASALRTLATQYLTSAGDANPQALALYGALLNAADSGQAANYNASTGKTAQSGSINFAVNGVPTGTNPTINAGDSWTINITGSTPNSPVYATANGSTTQMGTTDANGNFKLTGTFSSANAGAWNETWTVGNLAVGSVNFTMAATPTAQTGTQTTTVHLITYTDPKTGQQVQEFWDGANQTDAAILSFLQANPSLASGTISYGTDKNGNITSYTINGVVYTPQQLATEIVNIGQQLYGNNNFAALTPTQQAAYFLGTAALTLPGTPLVSYPFVNGDPGSAGNTVLFTPPANAVETDTNTANAPGVATAIGGQNTANTVTLSQAQQALALLQAQYPGYTIQLVGVDANGNIDPNAYNVSGGGSTYNIAYPNNNRPFVINIIDSKGNVSSIYVSQIMAALNPNGTSLNTTAIQSLVAATNVAPGDVYLNSTGPGSKTQEGVVLGPGGSAVVIPTPAEPAVASSNAAFTNPSLNGGSTTLTGAATGGTFGSVSVPGDFGAIPPGGWPAGTVVQHYTVDPNGDIVDNNTGKVVGNQGATPAASSSGAKTSAGATTAATGTLTLSQTTLTLAAGATQNVQFSIAPTATASQAITATSFNSAVAVATADSNGGVIHITAVSIGTAVITVHPTAMGSSTAQDKTITVTVASAAGSVTTTTFTTFNFSSSAPGWNAANRTLTLGAGSAQQITVTAVNGSTTSGNISASTSATNILINDTNGVITVVGVSASSTAAEIDLQAADGTKAVVWVIVSGPTSNTSGVTISTTPITAWLISNGQQVTVYKGSDGNYYSSALPTGQGGTFAYPTSSLTFTNPNTSGLLTINQIDPNAGAAGSGSLLNVGQLSNNNGNTGSLLNVNQLTNNNPTSSGSVTISATPITAWLVSSGQQVTVYSGSDGNYYPSSTGGAAYPASALTFTNPSTVNSSNSSGGGVSYGSGTGISYGSGTGVSNISTLGSVITQPVTVEGLQMPTGLQMPAGIDLSSRYANVSGTIYDKTTGHGFATPAEFFAAAGVNSFNGLIFDTTWQPAGQAQGAATTSSTTYTVQKGDTLWNIAKKYYGDGKQWRTILAANTSKVKNPKSLRVGTVLVIPGANS